MLKEEEAILVKRRGGTRTNDNVVIATSDALGDRRVDLATAGLESHYINCLRRLRLKVNASTIADFILSMRTEINLSDNHRKNFIVILTRLSEFYNKEEKSFKEMTRDDIVLFLDSFRKPEIEDPLHKWIGTYNLYRSLLLRFFRWLYYPDIESGKRSTPKVIENIAQLKRKEQSIYKPTDLWTIDDDLLFLRYCPNKRDRCYHAISRDTSCRPHEILKLKVKDVVFKNSGNFQYAEVLVNGKTGSRPIPLFNSIPYLKDWLDEHPQRANPNAPLICGYGKSLGRRLKQRSLARIYEKYKKEVFPKLLDDQSNVSVEDKQKIKEVLSKPWNPYIRRHSALTEKSTILKEHVLRQHAGWSKRSNMPSVYLHYFGNESNESLLEAYGIVTKDRQSQDTLKPKQCPNCNEGNKPDSKFCAKCRMVLTYDAYNETLEKQQERESEVKVLQHKYEQDMKSMRDQMENKFQQILTRIDTEKLG